MNKYPYEFKMKMITEYLQGPLSMQLLAEKYDLSHPSIIQSWNQLYKLYGKDGLKKGQVQPIYPVQFKKDVLQYKKRTGSSYQETANAFGMRFGTTIRSWYLIVQKEGMEGLKETKGPSTLTKKDKQPKKLKTSDLENKHIAKLEKENEQLRLENAYLKKLEAFQERNLPEKPKQKRHTPSNKKDSI